MSIASSNISISVFRSINNSSLNTINYDKILSAFKKTGVVLLRNWNFDSSTFQTFSQQFCDNFHSIGSRYQLRNSQGDGYSVEVFRNNFVLLAHTETSHRPVPSGFSYPPEVCFFMCVTPPAVLGGETTLVDGCHLLERISPPIRKRLQEVGIIYRMIWEPTRWQHEFQVENKGSLIQILDSLTNLTYKFLRNNDLELYYTTQAITPTLDGNQAFAVGLLAHLPKINHPHYHDKIVYTKPTNRVFFGDGEEIGDEIINEWIDIHDDLSYAHRWQAKDVLLIDNTRYLHGRTMTEKPCERVLLSRFGWLRKELK